MGLESVTQKVLKELDPRHDTDRIRARDYSLQTFLIRLASIPKHAVRGAVVGTAVGAGVGAAVSYFAGDNVPAWAAAGAGAGAGLGATVDMLQYVWRSDTTIYNLRKIF